MHNTATKVPARGRKVKEQVWDPSSPHKHNWRSYSLGGKAPAFLPRSRLFGQESRRETAMRLLCSLRLLHYKGSVRRKTSPQLRWACTSAQQPSRGWAMPLQHLPHLLHEDFHLDFADGYFWKMSSIPLSLQIFCYKRRGIPRPFTGKLPSIESCYLATAIKHCPRI